MICEEMRAEMRRKVVPENVIPQNIIEYLMDDSAELPELDAFTFLNRLRALGIGSADFQYLLEACDAPKECVEKVKRNPAMNLQNLILTLESSGLTAQDYTIMLYTARQIWEQTLTIRLEKTSETADEIDEETEENPEQIPVEEIETVPEENAADDDDEDFDEPSLAEVLEQVRLLEREMSYHGDDEDEPEKLPEIAPEEPEAPSIEQAEIAYDEEPEQSARNVGGLTSDFSKIFDKIKENKQAEREEAQNSAPEADDDYSDEDEEPVAKSVGALPTGTLSVTKILAGMQKSAPQNPAPQNDDIGDEDGNEEEIDDMGDEEAEISADEDYEDENFEDTSSLVHIDQTLFRKPKNIPVRKAEPVEEDEPDDEEYEDYDEDEEYDEDERTKQIRRTPKKYHIKALVAGAVGAAALTVLSVAAGTFSKKSPEIFFAESNDDIFSQIYNSYTAKNMGGETICEFTDTCEIFGDLLINKNGTTSFSDDKNVYTITSESVSTESFNGTMLNAAKYITPPNKTKIVTSFWQNDELYCVFSGDKNDRGEKECGYMKIKDGTTLFTVRQDGVLTDFSLEDGKIALGSVYVPVYSRSFSASDTDVFLPRLGKGEKAPLTYENIALSGTDGCSFAVCAEYTLESGENTAAKAVLGNPVSASADFRAALNGKTEESEYGVLIDFKAELSSKKCEKITAAAFGEGFAVTLEGENANIRNSTFAAKCALSNFAENAEKLKIIDKNLLVGNKDGFFSAFNCANPAEPAAVKLTKTNGIVSGDNAALFSIENGLTITYYKNEDGVAKVLGRYQKSFSDEELKTLVLKGAETTAFADNSCGAAFEYFDGVSVVAQYVVFGKNEGSKTLYDDKTGFTRAFAAGGKIYAVSSNGFDCVTGKSPLTE